MAELLKGTKRTHYCGLLREEHIGETVTIMGWVQKKRNLGALVFVDLRDREGVAQIMFDPDLSKEAFEKAEKTRGEFILAVTGEVHRRESINDNIPTGRVEVFAKEIKILSESDVPPIHINDEDKAGEQLRLKYRYLDLRKPKMQKRLRFRYQVSKIIRDFLDEEGFIDLETPILTKPTPEGARDYLVPSRVQQGKFFALPQSPQLFKQLFMVSGFDKYFQIVKCFRDEDLRADRQPEFTQVDMEMSFVEEEDVLALNERLIKRVFKDSLDVDVQLPIQRMPYAEAMERFGSDKPDTRFGFELKSLNEVLKNAEFQVFSGTIADGGMVKAINANGRAGDVSKKKIKNLEKFVKTYGAKGLAWIKLTEEGIESPIAKFLSEDELNGIVEAMDAKTGDMIFIVADKARVVYDSLGALRCELAKQFEMLNDKQYNLLWVTEFPLFEYDEEDGRYYAMHHPFTSPMDEDLDKVASDPGNARAKAYDIILNGVELGGGSIRIHDAELQKTMFKALGLSDEETEEKFGFLLNAFKYGTPPHGGVAFGLDRFVMLLIGAENIREVIAFPKTQDAKCPLTDAPSLADPNQLVELGIEVVASEDE